MKLRRDPASAAVARRFVGRALEEGHYPEQDVVVLLANELVTNAILHTEAEFDVVVDVAGRRVRVEVRDRSNRAPAARSAAPESVAGRGLALIEALAADWGVDQIPDDGKAVWFEVRSA